MPSAEMIERTARYLFAATEGERHTWEDHADDHAEYKADAAELLEAILPGAVIVPRSLIEETADALEKVRAKQITPNNGTHNEWLRKRIRALTDALEAAGDE